jgi:hypothetical protein
MESPNQLYCFLFPGKYAGTNKKVSRKTEETHQKLPNYLTDISEKTLAQNHPRTASP